MEFYYTDNLFFRAAGAKFGGSFFAEKQFFRIVSECGFATPKAPVVASSGPRDEGTMPQCGRGGACPALHVAGKLWFSAYSPLKWTVPRPDTS